jgi:cell division protein FtsB
LYKLIVFLLILIAGLQYRLWLGDGGIREYRETLQRIEDLKQEGEQRQIRNAAIAADVRDLREGTEAIEERARHDLGMIKEGETFVQLYDPGPPKRPEETAESTPEKAKPAGKGGNGKRQKESAHPPKKSRQHASHAR